MILNVTNEFNALKSVVVCWGYNVPLYEEYKTDDPEFTKYHPHSWDKDLLLKQQEGYFKLLERYNVRLVFPRMEKHLIWQMYSRDTAFVVGDSLYYSGVRKLNARNGEIDLLLKSLELPNEKVIKLDSEIEGGDVLVTGANSVYIGHGSRTTPEAISEMKSTLDVKVFELGENVMHLDTRLTLLPKDIVLANLESFDQDSSSYLMDKYSVVNIDAVETDKLGTNVFVLNPETIIVPTQHQRIANELKSLGLHVEVIDYTEPINLGGSFRCTTMPLERE